MAGRNWKNKKAIKKVNGKKLVLDLENDTFLVETKFDEDPQGYFYLHVASSPPVNFYYKHISETETQDEQIVLIDEADFIDLLYSYYSYLVASEITRITDALGADFFDEDI